MTTSLYASEGVVIESSTKNLEKNSSTTTNVYISSTHVSIETTGGTSSTIIFDASKEEFTYLDKAKKEYYLFDKATLIQLKEQMKMFAMMMKQFAQQMPAEQKKKLDQILNPSSAGYTNYTANGSVKVNNWNTTQYDGKNSGEHVASTFIASYQTIGIDAAKFNAMKKMMDFAQNNLKEIGALLPAGGEIASFSANSNSPVLKEGLPVKTQTIKSGAIANENVVNSVSLKDIDSGKFQVPSGYTRKTIDIQNQLGK